MSSQCRRDFDDGSSSWVHGLFEHLLWWPHVAPRGGDADLLQDRSSGELEFSLWECNCSLWSELLRDRDLEDDWCWWCWWEWHLPCFLHLSEHRFNLPRSFCRPSNLSDRFLTRSFNSAQKKLQACVSAKKKAKLGGSIVGFVFYPESEFPTVNSCSTGRTGQTPLICET